MDNKIKIGENYTQSAILDTETHKEGGGRRGYDRRQLYEYFHENSDRHGFLVLTQKEMAAKLGMAYQVLSTIITDFIDIGYMAKEGNGKWAKFRVLYHPDDCEWGEPFIRVNEKLRKRHQSWFREKNKE